MNKKKANRNEAAEASDWSGDRRRRGRKKSPEYAERVALANKFKSKPPKR